VLPCDWHTGAPVIKEIEMKLKAALLALMFAAAPIAHTAVVDPKEPPATPAGGAPEAGIGTAGAVGIAIGIGVIAAIASDDDDGAAVTGTGTGTGTQ
jgi:hypothetical protein